jgi:antitoxin ParD1/3/4
MYNEFGSTVENHFTSGSKVGVVKMNVHLPNDAMLFVEGLVASGEYNSANDAVVDGVRLLMSRQQVRADVHKGISELDAGLVIDGEQVFAELRESSRSMAEEE